MITCKRFSELVLMKNDAQSESVCSRIVEQSSAYIISV
jgi:hypothetical protein